jgi:16S rRNA (cytosine967-C5)-methyltransferase
VEEGAYADALLGHAPGTAQLPPRDRALLTRLVYGTLAWQGYLDHIITAFSHRPAAELDAPLRTLLRLALLQVCVLTKIPPFAAVNTAVELAKGIRGGAAAGLVNAVLRRAVAGWRDVHFPSRYDDIAGYLSTRLSHPRWLVEAWLAQYGTDDTEAMLRANNESAPTTVRVNRLMTEPSALLEKWRDGTAGELSRYSPVGVRVTNGGDPERLPGYADGWFSVQGEASQLVAFLLGARAGEHVLDVCAAPGGKATHMAELMDDRGDIVAIDLSAPGIRRLQSMAQRLGLSILHPTVADVTTWHPGNNKFDRILVDAPCSGLGTLRQHPEIKWRRTPEDIARLATLQERMLLRAAEWVRPGGVLVYATCTVSTAENEEVINAFLCERSSFVVDDPRPFLPQCATELIGSDGYLRTFPHRHGLDGFFAVRLKARRWPGIVRL